MKMKRHDVGNIGGRQFPNFGRKVTTQGHVIHLTFFLLLFSPFLFLKSNYLTKFLLNEEKDITYHCLLNITVM